jgi:menaquinone-dependent protoporphyrinogen oxidase
MGDRILVTYATWAGSTEGVAQTVAETLREGGASVDLLPMTKVRGLEAYGAVVVGSAARIGKINGDAFKFVKKHREALEHIPVAYFVVCLTMKDDTEEHRATVSAYLQPLREQVAPVDEGLFAGALELEKLGAIAKLAMSKMKAPEGDYRDFEAIKSWARELLPKLAPEV